MRKVHRRKKQPLVSVILPVYNGEDFIGQAIESIIRQTYKNLELIIVNDGSKDKTLKVIKQYTRYSKRIKLISYSKNKGESAAANLGFRKSKGYFIARMDADDISHPYRIKLQVKFLQENPHVIVVGSQAETINGQGEVIGKKTFPLKHKDIYQTYGIYHPMLHPSCMFRKNLLPHKDRLWENKREPNDDYYTLFGLLKHGYFANLPDFLVGYRIHKNNKSLSGARSKVFNILRIRLDAILHFRYQPTVMAILINVFQLLLAAVLPDRLIVWSYLFFRGMTSSHTVFAGMGRLGKAMVFPQRAFTVLRSLL